MSMLPPLNILLTFPFPLTVWSTQSAGRCEVQESQEQMAKHTNDNGGSVVRISGVDILPRELGLHVLLHRFGQRGSGQESASEGGSCKNNHDVCLRLGCRCETKSQDKTGQEGEGLSPPLIHRTSLHIVTETTRGSISRQRHFFLSF